MNDLMVKIFGASWRTSLFGVVQFVVGQAVNYYQSLAPGASFNWETFGGQLLLAVGLLLTKDGKVTGGVIDSGNRPK